MIIIIIIIMYLFAQGSNKKFILKKCDDFWPWKKLLKFGCDLFPGSIFSSLFSIVRRSILLCVLEDMISLTQNVLRLKICTDVQS